VLQRSAQGCPIRRGLPWVSDRSNPSISREARRAKRVSHCVRFKQPPILQYILSPFDTHVITAPAEGGQKGTWKMDRSNFGFAGPITLAAPIRRTEVLRRRKLGEAGSWRRPGPTSTGNSAKRLCSLCVFLQKSPPQPIVPQRPKTSANPCQPMRRGGYPQPGCEVQALPPIQLSKNPLIPSPSRRSHQVAPSQSRKNGWARPRKTRNHKPKTPTSMLNLREHNDQRHHDALNSRCAPWNCLSNPPEHRIGIPRRCVNEVDLSIVISRNKLTGLGIVWII
jgi:hypothetical protein